MKKGMSSIGCTISLLMLQTMSGTSVRAEVFSNDLSRDLKEESSPILAATGAGLGVGATVFLTGALIGSMGDPSPDQTEDERSERHHQYMRKLTLASLGIASVVGLGLGFPLYRNKRSESGQSQAITIQPVVRKLSAGIGSDETASVFGMQAGVKLKF